MAESGIGARLSTLSEDLMAGGIILTSDVRAQELIPAPSPIAAPPRTVADALQVRPSTPILYLEQITYLADHRPVEYSDVWIHPDRMRISALLPRR